MPGPFKEERLTPRLADTPRSLWLTYLILGLAFSGAYMLAGMSAFDALCHGFSTVSLGGFSTRSENIGYWYSPAIELVAGLFSLLSAIILLPGLLFSPNVPYSRFDKRLKCIFFFWLR